MTDGDSKDHWNDVYSHKGATDVSWFQPSLDLSLNLIEGLGVAGTAEILDVGGGASTLVDDLLKRGYSNISVLDLSEVALELSRQRLGGDAGQVTWIQGDVTEVRLPEARYDVWHDRAVFHFLTTPEARRKYVEQAHAALKPGGHIIVATFGLHGPEQCSGLDVARYDADGLHAEFGAPFRKVRQLTESHVTPWGAEQEFVYCYCRRRS